MVIKQLKKLVTLGLIITMITGSVGMTVSAAEADNLSTDIIMSAEEQEGSTEESSVEETASEAAVSEETDTESGTESVSYDLEISGEETDGGTQSQDEAAEESSDEQTDSSAEGQTAEQAAAASETEIETETETGTETETETETETGTEVTAETETETEESSDEQGTGNEAVDDSLAGGTAASYELTALTLDQSEAQIDEKASVQITATAVIEADSAETAADTAASLFYWTSSNYSAAKITAISEAVVTQNSQSEDTSGDGTETDQTQTAAAETLQFTITQTATVYGVAEGTAEIVVMADGEIEACDVTVVPVPVALASTGNLRWEDVTVLYWDSVKNAGSYRITTYLINNGNTYSKTITVKVTHYDLEDQITALIKTNKSKLKGNSYSIRAAVWAKPKDTVHYKMSAGVKSTTFRYQYATYQEAISRNGWFYKCGKWYYYDSGVKQTGWITFLSKKYYLDTDGSLKTNCWVGKYYVKSNGERAVSEWVDGYQYYVGANGLVDESVTFKTSNWVKNSKGWRFKTSAGYVKNTWRKISNRYYYFDASGYMKIGWLKWNGKKYYLKSNGDITAGRGVMQTGWVKVGSYYYWFKEDGSMATNEWVDRNQYYVGSTGRRLGHMNYMDLRNVNTSNRLGYYVYSSGSAPEQSIAGYDLSYSKGNRIMVVNLRFTKDNVPVCFHDDRVGYARYKNGRVPGSKPSVSGSTLLQLQNYDYGIKYGKQYQGTGPLTLEDMAKWIKSHGDTEVYIEVKVGSMSATQIKNTATILKKYGIVDRSSMIFDVSTTSDTRAQRVHKQLPTVRIGITTGSVGSVALTQAAKCKSVKNEVFLYCWKTTKLTSSNVKSLKNLDVQFECGTFDTTSSFTDALEYYTKGSLYAYTSGIETAGDVFNSLLRTATCHNKAHWVTTEAGRKYMLIDGTYVRSRWFTLNGLTYRFDKNGIMLTGWFKLDGKKYYLNSRGERVTGKRTIDGHMYLFNDDGVVVKRLT